MLDSSILSLGTLIFTDSDFKPQRPPRHQLSALKDRLVEVRAKDGRACQVGWVPEYSPGGAFLVSVDGHARAWADDWPGAEAALGQALRA